MRLLVLLLTMFPLLAVCATRPNIIFILADDLGSYDVSWRGGEIKTPNLDKLARAGAQLEQFYVQPVCTPTRAALLTGRYPMRYGLQVGVIRPNAEYGLPLEERMLPETLREAGYTTAMVGKWHLGSFDKRYWPNARGFDFWYGHLFGALDYFTHLRDGKHDWYRNGETNRDEGYTTHLLAREAVRAIKDQPKSKPLFLYVAFNAVHGPLQAPGEYKKPYEHFSEPRRTYAGVLAAMDEAVGQIVSAVDETGRRRDTLFIFSSDNGGPQPGRVRSNGTLRAGKGTLYEGGVRVAAFATWEGHIRAGTLVNAPLHMVDWYPTLLRLAGASGKQKLEIDGRDIWPCLTRGKKSPHSEILLNATPAEGAIRSGDWKLVLREKTDSRNEQIELFNLETDPGEKTNLATEQPKKVQQLRRRYTELSSGAVTPKNKRNESSPVGD